MVIVRDIDRLTRNLTDWQQLWDSRSRLEPRDQLIFRTGRIAQLTRWEKRMSKFDAQFAGRLDGQTVLVTGTTKGGIGP